MRVVERLMGVGDFALSLRPDAPKSTRDTLQTALEARDGYIVVFDTPTDHPALANALSVGWLTKHMYDGTTHSYEGIDLAGLMQDNGNLGEHVAANVDYSSRSLSSWLDVLFPFGGITKGAVTTTGLTSAAAQWTMGLGLREMLDYVCSLCGGVWRLNTDGSVDAASPSNLFGDTPSVMISRDVQSSLGGDLRGIDGGVTGLLDDVSQIAKRTIGYGAGTSASIEIATSSASGTVAVGIDGNAVQIDRPLDLANSTGSELSSLTSAAQSRWESVRRQFGVAGVTSGVRSVLGPGDPVYVYDLDAGVEDTSNAVTFAGEVTFPQNVRVLEMEWYAHRGQAVYLHRPGESAPDDWVDLTHDMPHAFGAEQSSYALTVGSDLTATDLVKVIGPDRIGIQRPDEVVVRLPPIQPTPEPDVYTPGPRSAPIAPPPVRPRILYPDRVIPR